MRVLVACEESQEECKAFRAQGHEAYSCDIQECSGGHPEWHIQGNCLLILNGYRLFWTMDGAEHDDVLNDPWDLIIAHPPCTYLCSAANRWYNVEKYGDKATARLAEREKAVDFFYQFVFADCDRIAIENPVGIMSTRWRKPDQIIQPYMFGHPVRKSTCLWLKNLPILVPTAMVGFETDRYGLSGNLRYARDENGKILPWNDPRTAKIRSKTYRGIAQAMAEQWGNTMRGGM